ncbi:MAG TPA: hypothetical protein VG838_06330 [Opitutaceae bacterium]|nr:hypothetical protein [Opitutaceae bacterium]
MKPALLPASALLASAFLCAGAAQPPAPAAADLPELSVVAPPQAPKTEIKSGGWVFSLIPRSMQKNPKVEMTVITEMTDDGKRLPAVTPAHPAYYLGQSGGFHSIGDGPSDAKAPPPDALSDMLKKALAANGYLTAQPPAQPPSVLIVYIWGAHYALHPEEDDSISPEAVMRNILDRASLVGGAKFAQELQKLFEQKADMIQANTPPPVPDDPSGLVKPINPILDQDAIDAADPIRLFAQQSPKNAFIIDQAFDDVYYVVASAYDYQAIGQHQRKLLWRTRMTVDSKGVAMLDTIPTLIDTAAPYFGREMDEPETLMKHALKEGKVEVGTPTVVEPGKK